MNRSIRLKQRFLGFENIVVFLFCRLDAFRDRSIAFNRVFQRIIGESLLELRGQKIMGDRVPFVSVDREWCDPRVIQHFPPILRAIQAIVFQ